MRCTRREEGTGGQGDRGSVMIVVTALSGGAILRYDLAHYPAALRRVSSQCDWFVRGRHNPRQPAFADLPPLRHKTYCPTLSPPLQGPAVSGPVKINSSGIGRRDNGFNLLNHEVRRVVFEQSSRKEHGA